MAGATPHLTQPGAKLGRFELERWLGEGGFAEVWLAKDTADPDGPRVAVKVMRRGRARDPRHKMMFLDEAHIASNVAHPNVARVLEVGDADGFLFIAMEYVDGGSLDTLVQGARALEEPIPPGVALRLVADVCAGLHAAHELVIDGREQHVIHRDVSPQNILLTRDGVPKLIDFGIAKARERLAKETSTGVAKGKISYMSPEQARGAEIDRRADIWAVGAVLFELLEGRRAVEGPNEVARLDALVRRPLHPTFEHTPPAVIGIVERALAFYPRDRHASADELRRDLERAIAESNLETSQHEIASFARRAREAAEGAHDEPRLSDVIGGRTHEPTLSAIVPATTTSSAPAQPRERGARFVAGGLAAIAVAAIAIFAARRDPRGATSIPSSAAELPPAPIAMTGIAAQPAASTPASTPTPAPSSTAAASATQAASSPTPATTPPAPKPSRALVAPKPSAARPNDDDQIE